MDFNKKTIGVDMDNTIFPLLEAILPAYNLKYNDTLTIQDFKEYDVRKTIHSECKNFFGEFVTKSIFKNARPYEKSVEVLTKLSEDYNILFVTACDSNTLGIREEWLKTFFPFFESSMLVRMKYKSQLNIDLLIDDYDKNLKYGNYKKILFVQPWNHSSVGQYDSILCWNDFSYYYIRSILGKEIEIK